MIPVAIILALTGPSMDQTASPSLQSCSFPQSIAIVLRKDDIPTEIIGDIEASGGMLADRDQPFQKYDNQVGSELAIRRLIAGLHVGNDWVIVYEHGVSYHIQAVRYYGRPEMPPSVGYSYMRSPRVNLVGDLCAVTTAALANVGVAALDHL